MENISGKLSAVEFILSEIERRYKDNIDSHEAEQKSYEEYCSTNSEDERENWRMQNFIDNMTEYKNKAEAYDSIYQVIKKNLDKII